MRTKSKEVSIQLPENDSSTSPDSNNASSSNSIFRRQSFTSAVHALTANPAPKAKAVLSRIVGVGSGSNSRKSSDINPAHPLTASSSRSKSCSNLPALPQQEETATLVDDQCSTVSPAPTQPPRPSTSTRKDKRDRDPSLTLTLGSTSFLDTTIFDGLQRMYVTDTRNSTTNISREDRIQGVVHVGRICWSTIVSDNPVAVGSENDRAQTPPKNPATIQMAHGRRYYVEDFLKRTKLTSSRLFSIPYYPHTLKWKRSGSLFKLVAAKAKALIATLEPAVLAAPPRIRIFETLYEPDPTRPQPEHQGVPIFLLDYVITTALLLIAERDEWLSSGSATSALVGSTYRRGAQGSIQQWRMEVQTEPFVPLSEMGSRPSSPTTSSVVDITHGVGGGKSGFGSVADLDEDASEIISLDEPSTPGTVLTVKIPWNRPAIPRQPSSLRFVDSNTGEGGREEEEEGEENSIFDIRRESNDTSHIGTESEVSQRTVEAVNATTNEENYGIHFTPISSELTSSTFGPSTASEVFERSRFHPHGTTTTKTTTYTRTRSASDSVPNPTLNIAPPQRPLPTKSLPPTPISRQPSQSAGFPPVPKIQASQMDSNGLAGGGVGGPSNDSSPGPSTPLSAVSSTMSSSGGGRRPYRPLPRPPGPPIQEYIPPVPSLPTNLTNISSSNSPQSSATRTGNTNTSVIVSSSRPTASEDSSSYSVMNSNPNQNAHVMLDRNGVGSTTSSNTFYSTTATTSNTLTNSSSLRSKYGSSLDELDLGPGSSTSSSSYGLGESSGVGVVRPLRRSVSGATLISPLSSSEEATSSSSYTNHSQSQSQNYSSYNTHSGGNGNNNGNTGSGGGNMRTSGEHGESLLMSVHRRSIVKRREYDSTPRSSSSPSINAPSAAAGLLPPSRSPSPTRTTFFSPSSTSQHMYAPVPLRSNTEPPSQRRLLRHASSTSSIGAVSSGYSVVGSSGEVVYGGGTTTTPLQLRSPNRSTFASHQNQQGSSVDDERYGYGYNSNVYSIGGGGGGSSSATSQVHAHEIYNRNEYSGAAGSRPSYYTRPPPSEEEDDDVGVGDDGDGEDGEDGYLGVVPPPSYDSIDFSRPPLKHLNGLEIT